MSRPPADDRDGNLEIQITCPGPGCGQTLVVYYTTCPPTYCSDACKQRAYRHRKAKRQAVTTPLPPDVTPSPPKRTYNRIRTDTLENLIAGYKARQQFEAAQALYDLAATIGAPIRQAVIDQATKQRRQFLQSL